MNSWYKPMLLMLALVMCMTIQGNATEDCEPCEEPEDPTLVYQGADPCRPKDAGAVVTNEACKECDGKGGVRNKSDNTPCEDKGFVCCKGICFGFPQVCGECDKPSDCMVFAVGGAACLPDDGKKCKEDECKRGPRIQGATLSLSPAYEACLREKIAVSTGAPTDEDYLFKYRCANGLCQQAAKDLIPGTVAVSVKSNEGRYNTRAYRTYTAIFTSECGDPAIVLRKTIFILDCANDLFACLQDVETNNNWGDPGNGFLYCSWRYSMCKKKCGALGFE